MRRLAAAALLAGLAWSLLTVPASGHEASGQWTSPAPPTPEAPSVGMQPELSGAATHDDQFRPVVEVTFAVKSVTERPAACPEPPQLPAWPAEGGTVSWRFLPGSAPEQPEPGAVYYGGFVCNGTYELVARPRVANDLQHGQPPPIRTTLALAVPAAPPSDVRAELAKDEGERVARIEWTPPAELPPDAAGYLVERSINGGEWEQLGIAADGEPAWQDGAPHRNAGEFHYRVSTVRLGPSGTTDDLVVSAPAEERVLDVPATSTATTGPVADNAGPPPGPRQLATSGRTEGPRQGAVVSPGPPTTVDNGFNQTLDYGGRRPVSSAGDGGGSVLDVLGETPEQRKELLTPIAAALVFLMWFVLIRYLLRQAAKQPVASTQSSTA